MASKWIQPQRYSCHEVSSETRQKFPPDCQFMTIHILHLFRALAHFVRLQTKAARKGAEREKKIVEPEQIRRDKIMMPVQKKSGVAARAFQRLRHDEWVDKSNVTAPAVNILETEDDFKVSGRCGHDQEDFKVSYHRGQRTPDHDGEEGRAEGGGQKHRGHLPASRVYSQFQQSLILPDTSKEDRRQVGMAYWRSRSRRRFSEVPAARQIARSTKARRPRQEATA